MRVERSQQASLVERYTGLDLCQRIPVNEERRFHGTVVPPEADGMYRLVVEPAVIGEVEHRAGVGLLADFVHPNPCRCRGFLGQWCPKTASLARPPAETLRPRTDSPHALSPG